MPGRIVVYLDSLPLSRVLRDRQARLASLRQLQAAMQEELSPPFHFGDASQSALLPSVLACTVLSSERAFKGEL